MEAVLPLKIRPDGRAMNLGGAVMLCHSLAYFWRDVPNLALTVICPPDDLAAARDALGNTPGNIDIRFVDETELVPGVDENPAFPGWLRQQVLKLAVYGIVRSDFYLCLDADVLCINPIDAALLLPGGKALTEYGNRKRHGDWWRHSAALLKVDPHLDRPGMRVTPAVLSRHIVEGLHQALPRDGDTPSWQCLMQAPGGPADCWTEYTLYQLFAEQADLMKDFHISFAESRALDRPLISGRSIWSRQDAERFDPTRLFDARDRALFAVLQSSAHPPLGEIWAGLRARHGVAGPSVLRSFDQGGDGGDGLHGSDPGD